MHAGTMQSVPRDEELLETDELEALPRTYVEVRRAQFRLTVWRRAKNSRIFRPAFHCFVATGADGFSTPTGPHIVRVRALNPSWTAPDSKWARDAGYKPGDTIPGGDDANPITGAWIELTSDGVGIHGTRNLLSLRSRASHGCIRVSTENARKLYRLIEVGSIVRVR